MEVQIFQELKGQAEKKLLKRLSGPCVDMLAAVGDKYWKKDQHRHFGACIKLGFNIQKLEEVQWLLSFVSIVFLCPHPCSSKHLRKRCRHEKVRSGQCNAPTNIRACFHGCTCQDDAATTTPDTKVAAMHEEPTIHEHLWRCWSCYAPSEDLRRCHQRPHWDCRSCRYWCSRCS